MQMLLRDKLLSGVKKYVYGGQYGKDYIFIRERNCRIDK